MKLSIDKHGNLLQTCWRCGTEHGIHRDRCPECDAHRALAPQREEGGE